MTKELDSAAFEEMRKDQYAVIDCYSTFCTACEMLAPTFDKVASSLPGVSFGRINLDFAPEYLQEFSIQAFPTILFLRNGEYVNTVLGSVDEETLLENIGVMLYQ